MQVEDFDFLGRLHAGADLAQVIELAPFRRPLEIERIPQRIEVCLADEGRNQRNRQQHDQPGRVDHQAHRQADHGNGVLHLAEQLAHQVHAVHGLASRAIQLVLPVRVFEILQIQLRGMFHQTHAGGVVEQLRQQRIGVADQPAEQVRADRQRQFQRQQFQKPVQAAAAQGLRERVECRRLADQMDRLVDDQFADV